MRAWLLGIVLAGCLAPLVCAAETAGSVDACLTADAFRDTGTAYDACAAALQGPSLTPQVRVKLLIARADALIWAGRQGDAIKDLDEALTMTPNDADALVMRGRAWTGLQDFGKAERDLSDVLSRDDKNVKALRGMARLYDLAGQSDMAMNIYRQALTADPNFHRARYELAELEYDDPNGLSQALADVERILQASPEVLKKVSFNPNLGSGENKDFFIQVSTLKGDILDRQRRYQEALAVYDGLLATHPDLPGVHFDRAGTRIEVGDYAGAMSDIAEAEKCVACRNKTQILKIQALFHLNRYDETIAATSAGLLLPATDKDRGLMYFYRAYAYRGKGNIKQAQTDVLMSFGYDPWWQMATLNHARMRHYYDGDDNAPLGEPQKNAVEACMVDPEC